MSRIFAYSDLHLMPGQENPLFMKFLDIIIAEEPNIVIEVGDGDECAWFSMEEIMADPVSRKVIDVELEIARRVDWIKLPGNHNPEIWRWASALNPIHVGPAIDLIEGIRFEHGDRYDPTIRWWNMWLANRFVKKRLPWLHDRLFGSPAQWKPKDRLKWQWMNAQYGLFYEKLAVELSRPVVYGHAHQAYIKTLEGGLWVANCGDMVDSFTFLEIVDGIPHLRELRQAEETL